MDSRRIIKAIEAGGWELVATKCDHWQFKRPTRSGRVIRKNAGSDYGVDFNDLLGCVTAGRTLDEARRMAAEALTLHVEGMVEDHKSIPEPAKLDDIMADPHNAEAVAFLVEVATKPSRSVRMA